MFWVCRPCFRGQAYCREACRHRQRAQQRRRANHRHQQSSEGRLDHRDRQRTYRTRLARVTDQGSEPIAPSCTLLSSEVPATPGTAIEEVRHARTTLSGRPRCLVCGRVGSWVVPFAGEG